MLKIERNITIKLRSKYKVLNIDNGSSRAEVTRNKISKNLSNRYNGGTLKWNESNLRKLAGNKLYSKTEFSKKYSYWAVSVANKLGISEEIFKPYFRPKIGNYKK